ncbi:MAG: TolC family protein [Proteobacteria bacterium]|nr:TolC family protein [Pseudomonadota bacterium]
MRYCKINLSMIKKWRTILLTVILICYSNAGIAADDVPQMITLSEGLKIVTKQGRAVKIAGFSERIAESDVNVARSGLLPRIDASAGHTSLDRQPAMTVNGMAINTSDSHHYSYSISIQQILFDFYGSLSRYQASSMLLEAKKFDSARIRNSAALEFTVVFYELLESEHLVVAADKDIERLEAHYRDADKLYKAGVTTRNDLLQVQVRLSDARQKQLTLKNLEALRSANLNNLLLRPLNSPVRAEEINNPILPPSNPDLEQLWMEALKKRAEIKIVDRTLNAINLETVAKKSEFLPKFFVRASNDYMENSYQLHENNWSLMFGVNINLFEGGRSMANLQKTGYQKNQLLEQRARLVDEIKLELQRYTLDLHNAYARILANQDAVDQAQENLRINKRRYEEGEGTATQVLDAVTLMTNAETNRIRSIYDYRRAEAATHYATGIDLREIYK